MSPDAVGRPFRIGLNLPYVERQMDGATPRWRDMLAMAQAAEAIGMDAVWVSDHVLFGSPSGDPAPDQAEDAGADPVSGAWESWTVLSALAVAVPRVELGTYVTCTAFRNAALLAKMAETLDESSGGRLILGLGAGWNEPEFRAYGFPFERRVDRFEESLRIISAMLREGRATLDGTLVQVRDAVLRPRGPRPDGLPIMVGSNGPRMLRLTAELADMWNAGMAPAAEMPDLIARVDAACAEVGRDPATLARSAEVLVRPIAPPDGEGPGPDDRELRGSPSEIASGILAYRAFGLAHLQVQLRPNTLAAVHAFAEVLGHIDAA